MSQCTWWGVFRDKETSQISARYFRAGCFLEPAQVIANFNNGGSLIEKLVECDSGYMPERIKNLDRAEYFWKGL